MPGRELPGIQLVAVKPAGSPVLSRGEAARHGIQGIRAGFIPPIMDGSLIDDVISVTDEEAVTVTMARQLSVAEGLIAGIASGAAAVAAPILARRLFQRGRAVML